MRQPCLNEQVMSEQIMNEHDMNERDINEHGTSRQGMHEQGKGERKKVNGAKTRARENSPIDPARVFHALGDPTRRALVEMLSRAPRTVSSLAAAVEVTVTAIGQHLAILEACGLARTEKLGRTRTCSLERTGLDALERWIGERRSPLEQSLDRLGDLLAEENSAAKGQQS